MLRSYKDRSDLRCPERVTQSTGETSIHSDTAPVDLGRLSPSSQRRCPAGKAEDGGAA